MAEKTTRKSVKLAALVTAALFVLLLAAPWVPPNVALFGAVALFLLWAVVFFGGREIYHIIVEEIEAYREAQRPDEGTPEYIQQQYKSGEITEAEMKRQLDEALGDESLSTESEQASEHNHETET